MNYYTTEFRVLLFLLRDRLCVSSSERQASVIEAFNSNFKYLDDVLNTDNIYFEEMVDKIYPKTTSA